MSKRLSKKIGSGIYLVIDPSMDELTLLHKLTLCIKEKLVAVQIWDNFKNEIGIAELIHKICKLCHSRNIPVLINNRWDVIPNSLLDGVHFDSIPENYAIIKETLNKPFISGLTCNNDLTLVSWASENELDYISFCSIFPSSTANSCELVRFTTIQKVAEHYALPIFLAGGIKPENMKQLEELNYTGIAVISGIMSSDQPDESIKKYQEQLNSK